MRTASILGLAIGLLLVVYTFYQDTEIESGESRVYSKITTGGGSLSAQGEKELQGIIESYRDPWRFLLNVSLALTVLSGATLTVDLCRNRQP